jgi:hypothetical protein
MSNGHIFANDQRITFRVIRGFMGNAERYRPEYYCVPYLYIVNISANATSGQMLTSSAIRTSPMTLVASIITRRL